MIQSVLFAVEYAKFAGQGKYTKSPWNRCLKHSIYADGAKMADFLSSFIYGLKKRWVDMGDGTHAEQQIAHPPFNLMTDGGTGANRRNKVEIGSTDFWLGREFRTFKEFSIASSATLVVRVFVPVNTILKEQSIEIDAGSIRITNTSGGTSGGTFSETLPVIGKNNMSDRPSPFYMPQVVFTSGGTHTGGFVFDVHRAVASNATAQQSTVGRVVGDERGVAANTYHVRYENIGNATATGTFWFIWAERP